MLATQYQALYSVIGNIYGGDTRTFNLPDLRGSAPMGMGQGPGLTNRTLGPKSVGAPTVTLTPPMMPQHNHTLTEQSTSVNANIIPAPSNAYLSHGLVLVTPPATYDGFFTYATYDASKQTAFREPALSPAGGGGSHDNNQPSLLINFCICLVGVYPIRP
jgi:microcystin-dependent protein